MFEHNIVTLCDSYKMTHAAMYPKGTQRVYSYFEARSGAEFPRTMFFGLQYLLKEYLEGVVVTTAKIDAAERLAAVHFGNPKLFDRERWDYIVREHQGRLPVRIMAVAEGTVVENSNVLMTVENTDDNCWWLTNHLETLLCHVWASATVATLSYTAKQIFERFLEETSDSAAGLPFMLHDFGMRGVSSMESAGIEGCGHLVNFMGTDTVIAMEYAMKYYDADPQTLAFSVPATEHSIMTAGGRGGEEEVIEALLDAYPTGILSVVSDSYDIYNCVENIYGKTFRERILARDGKFVVRPDSGNPIETVLRLLEIMYRVFGGAVNSKGYKVINPKVGLLWGDGLDLEMIEKILVYMRDNDWSASNIVFGMGGGLLQKINRDTQRFAFKSSAQQRDGVWYDISKEPLDKTKTSKRGKLKLVVDPVGGFHTVGAESEDMDRLRTVFINGELQNTQTFEEIRGVAAEF